MLAGPEKSAPQPAGK